MVICSKLIITDVLNAVYNKSTEILTFDVTGSGLADAVTGNPSDGIVDFNFNGQVTGNYYNYGLYHSTYDTSNKTDTIAQ